MLWKTIDTAPIGKTHHDEILVCFKGQFAWVYFVAYPNGAETNHPGYANPTHWTEIKEPKETK